MKKTLLVAILALIIALALTLFLMIPRTQIEVLKTGFVKTEVSKDGVPTYTIVPKKPKNWVTLAQIPKGVWGALLVSEDWAFFEHKGVDVNQLKGAIEDTLEHGKGLRGASTISQQVVKNLFLTHERSFTRKAREFLITLYMERELEKRKILEIYLNIIEFHPGVYGLDAASRFYFKKSAANLTVREAAFLAMLLPNPKVYSQSFRDKNLSDYARSTIESILDKLVQAGFITKADRELLRDVPLSFEKRAAPVAPVLPSPRLAPNDGKLEFRAPRDGDMAVDPDLQLPDVPEYDPNDRLENLESVEEEFRVE